MSDKHEEQVAGVTFFFESSGVSKALGTEKFRVRLELNCEVHNEELWNEVEKKFRDPTGFRVFTEEDFHIAVMDAMRLTIQELERTKYDLERRLRQAEDGKKVAEEQLAQYKEPFIKFGQALRGH
jgi:hypothetical protein